MAAGCPIVSTSIGAEGLEITDEENILIADTSESFASAVVEVLTNIELQKQLGYNATMLVRDKYNWETIARLHDNFYLGMVNENGNRSIQPSVECPIPN
jgi:glycosyltransferase involved in cell wall biosynthesis